MLTVFYFSRVFANPLVGEREGYKHCLICDQMAISDSTYAWKQDTQCLKQYGPNLSDSLSEREKNNSWIPVCNIGDVPSKNLNHFLCYRNLMAGEFMMNFFRRPP